MKTKSLVLSNTYVTKVQRLDALGQGVCLVENNTVFVPKTLPGEEIEIVITEKKKGVYWGELKTLLQPAKIRQDPECAHFSICGGCSYQQIQYKEELSFKKQSLERNLSYLSNKNYTLEILAPEERFYYRNRIQLHYQLTPQLKIGFMNKNKLISIKECLLPQVAMQKYFHKFLLEWNTLVPPNSPAQGHVELYFQNDKIHLSWNSSYSQLGFSQVNDRANQLLQDCLRKLYASQNEKYILELFCGQGNLLSKLESNHLITGFDVNGTLSTPHRFIKVDLFKPSGVEEVIAACKKSTFHDLILDPPRSGFIQLAEIVKESLFERLLYVSCWPSSMVRDLNEVYKIRPWKNCHVFLIDMFPCTKHYETLFVIQW